MPKDEQVFGKTLTPKELKMAEAYLTGATMEQIATQFKMHRPNVYTQLRKAHVRQYLKEVVQSQMDLIRARALASMEELNDMEMDLCRSAKAEDALRLSAIHARFKRLETTYLTEMRHPDAPLSSEEARVQEEVSDAEEDAYTQA